MTSRPWLVAEIGLGDTRLPIEAAVRLDGTVLLKIGDEDVVQYDTLCDAEQLSDLIEILTMVRDCAVKTTEELL